MISSQAIKLIFSNFNKSHNEVNFYSQLSKFIKPQQRAFTQLSSLSAKLIPNKQQVVLFNKIGSFDEIKVDNNYPTPQIESDYDIIVKNHYAGVNYIEAYFRTGEYPSNPPMIFGREASGEVVEVGSQVDNLKPGDKIAYLSPSTFAQYTKITNDNLKLLKLPPSATDQELQIFGSILLQGLTALTFVKEPYKVEKGDDVLVWAAAGGVGNLLVQLINQVGGNAIAVASNDTKLKLAAESGAKYLINSTTDNIEEKVRQFTNGKGVEAVYDSIGKDTFDISLNSLATAGTFVSFGNASGPVTPFSLSKLSTKNIKVSRPSSMVYLNNPQKWNYYSGLLLDLLNTDKLKFNISKVYELQNYRQAAEDLESRRSHGKLTLKIPQ
ncbi:Hgt17 glucose transporter [Candida orthopsilosis Co 90-125]|uniref:Probable quinone oxidoreductase n=1 Tax=Candida orthopsilosis (strain 90-125) TaxID=1136231 RepID=H8X7F6_CANO9|nr:Hgt17 glucose transporter [Candida orthopsilosis Co 90-125]CCG23740.1 Hgt17 glucose transporter [Candida orthopsilosis Co 90-125]